MISTERLTKVYDGLVALDGLTLDVPAGEVFGLIGPNGAGKTTTLRILATLLRPTAGQARIGGKDLRAEAGAVRRMLGFVPDAPAVYPDTRVEEYLTFFAALYGLRGRAAGGRIGDVLELTDLVEKRHAPVEALSRGMQQRLSVARVLLHDPQVLLLDEPASGLDPRARVEMRELLRELCAMGKTILLSSHILYELAELCSSVAILQRGRLVFHGSMETLLRRVRPDPIVELRLAIGPQETPVPPEAPEAVAPPATEEERGVAAEDAEDGRPEAIAAEGRGGTAPAAESGAEAPAEAMARAARIFAREPRIREARAVGGGLFRIHLEEGAAPSLLPPLLVREGIVFDHLREYRPTLEDAFLHLTDESGGQSAASTREPAPARPAD